VSATWFYAIDDREEGPITPQELKKLADSGQLKPTDQVWKEGMPEWVAAGSIKNLCPAGAVSKEAKNAVGNAPASAAAATSAPTQTRRTEPVVPANEIRREALPTEDADDEL
jgi:hypothetical protein